MDCSLREDIRHKYYVENKSQTQISVELGVSQWKISQLMKSYGFVTKSKTRALSRKKYEVDECCLDLLTTTVAWVLGWYLADGNINRKDNSFILKLSPKDEQVLCVMKSIFGYNGPLLAATTKLKNGKKYKSIILKISSRKLRTRLVEYGITPGKTENEKYLECIQGVDLDRHFIKGVFEGDGSILCYRKCTIFQIVGTKELLTEIQLRLMKHLNLRKTKLYKHKKSKNHYMLRYSGKNQVRNIARWLYHDSIFHLNRKYQIYQKLEEL